MVKAAKALLNIRYIFYIVIIALSAVMIALMLKAVHMTYNIFLYHLESKYSILIHKALEVADVCLVIVLLATIANYLLFRFIITDEKIDLMPKWAANESQKQDSYQLKSSIAVTSGAIFLIFLLGEIIDPETAIRPPTEMNSGGIWPQLALYSLLLVSILILSISAWIARKN